MASMIDLNGIPLMFPTHRHDPAFWEMLGRTVATYGFLEEVLGKAIFAFTATKPYADDKIDAAYKKWLSKLESALTDPLGNLINAYGKAVREHPSARIKNLDELIDHLRKAAAIRNVICHGSWRIPDEKGASFPFFMNRQKMVFDTAVDRQFLAQTQKHVAELACAVIETVTQMGWQFPGSSSPGVPFMDH
jgi:hypothetical protein